MKAIAIPNLRRWEGKVLAQKRDARMDIAVLKVRQCTVLTMVLARRHDVMGIVSIPAHVLKVRGPKADALRADGRIMVQVRGLADQVMVAVMNTARVTAGTARLDDLLTRL